MKKILLTPLFILIFVFSGCSFDLEDEKNQKEQEDQGSQQEQFVQVLHVYDGDTFSVWVDEKVEDVRVIGVDAPETGEKYTKKECFGKESTQKAIEILGEEKVKLVADPTQDDRDQYGRILRQVFLEDRTNFGLKMIEEGFAREYTFKGRQYEHQDEFVSAQEKAKNEKRGLWGVCKKDE